MRTKAIKAVLLTSLVAVAASFQSTNATNLNAQAGSNCMAINLNQALELRWTEKGIRNVSPTRSFWITCPVPQVSPATATDLDARVYIENTTAAAQTVTCIGRRFDDSAVLQETVSVDIAVPANDVAFGTVATSDTPGNFDFYSLTCALLPGTGVTHYVND